VYSASEVGHLAGVPGDRVGQWARWGHIAASVSAGEPHVYGWDDAAEALAVHELIERGLGLREIRWAVAALGGAATWPLARAGVHVVHGRIAIERGGELIDLRSGAQEVLALDGRIDPVGLLRNGGWPARALGLRRIEVDPARLGGRPTIRGHRIAVQEADEELELDDGEVAEAKRWLAGA
jgi:hypothetical protein